MSPREARGKIIQWRNRSVIVQTEMFMLSQDHVVTAQTFLDVAGQEFESGNRLQASEKLWGAASHAVMAVACHRGWGHCTHRDLKNAVQRLAQESGDAALHAGFLAAEKFLKNFYRDEMEDFEIEIDRPLIHTFVAYTLTLLE